jgi:Fe-S-cluster containining protein
MEPDKCQRCNNCCTSFGVCVTIFDIIRIAGSKGVKPREFVTLVEDYHPRERTEPAVLLEGKKYILVLKHDARRVCTFFDGKGCGIHSERPYLCRTYPFTLKNGELADIQNRACLVFWQPKGEDREKYVSDLHVYSRQIEEYKKIVDEWNSKHDGSLDEFIQFATAKQKGI